MSTGHLTEKQEWIVWHGFYGHWWDFAPYNTTEYQRRFRDFMAKYEAGYRISPSLNK